MVPYLFSLFNSCSRIKTPGEREFYLLGLDNIACTTLARAVGRRKVSDLQFH